MDETFSLPCLTTTRQLVQAATPPHEWSSSTPSISAHCSKDVPVRISSLTASGRRVTLGTLNPYLQKVLLKAANLHSRYYTTRDQFLFRGLCRCDEQN